MTPPRPSTRHPVPCPDCYGRGWYPDVDEAGDECGERYCGCAAGMIAQLVDGDAKLSEEEAAQRVLGCSRAELWEGMDAS